MSILIKGMEMPPNCCQCPVNMEVCKRGYEYLLAHPELYDKRADDCPIVEIPPHGRLGDLDALYEQCDDPHWCVWRSEIEDAPTIIEAEEVNK